MRPLYQIANEYLSLMNELMECDEISDEQLAAINLIEGDVKQKATNVASVIQNLQVEADGIEKALERMVDRNRQVENKISRLRDYLKVYLEKCDIKEVNSPEFDIKLKLNNPAVVVKDEQAIPHEYFKEKTTVSLDRARISLELKQNIMIPGVALERAIRLEIK